MITVKTNLPSLKAQYQLNKNKNALSTAIERLSSGVRINSAKDDAAGLAIANRMSSQYRGQNVAIRNVNDGISLIQVSEKYLSDINERLQRIRELTVQGLNGSYSDVDKDTIQTEINLNFKEIDRLNSLALFNGINLLDGSAGNINLQVGSKDEHKLALDLGGDGFDVNALSLLDFTIQGDIPKTLEPVSVIKGAAQNVPLYDDKTTLTYSPSANDPVLVDVTAYGSSNGQLYKVKDDGGRLYNVSISGMHDTDTLENNVSISKRSYGNYQNQLASDIPLGNIPYTDQDGQPISLEGQLLVHIGGKNYIRVNTGDADDPYQYYEAHLDYFVPDNSSYATVTRVEMVDGQVITQSDLGTTNTGGDSRYMPQISGINAHEETIFKLDDNNVDKNEYSLVQLNAYYYLEHFNGTEYEYFRARVEVTNRGESDSQAILVTADSNKQLKTEDSTHLKRGINSTIHLKPENNNVEVNYRDQLGITHKNVLSVDKYGNYQFNIQGPASSPYKRGSLVQDQEGNYYIKTIDRGEAELYLYYPIDLEQITNNGSTNVDHNKTTITFKEDNEIARFRTPEDPLATLDRAIGKVDKRRSYLGAVHNRLDSAISQLTVSNKNIAASRSRIEDADYAIEVSNMTRAQILQQAGAAVLAQANQVPQTILNLLT